MEINYDFYFNLHICNWFIFKLLSKLLNFWIIFFFLAYKWTIYFLKSFISIFGIVTRKNWRRDFINLSSTGKNKCQSNIFNNNNNNNNFKRVQRRMPINYISLFLTNFSDFIQISNFCMIFFLHLQFLYFLYTEMFFSDFSIINGLT